MRAAIEVMAEDSYEGASMRRMAARARVSTAALYHHFPSKLDLLREFIDDAYDVILARIDEHLAASDPIPVDRLDAIVGILIASQLHDEFAQVASKVALREQTRLNPPDRAAIDAKRCRLLDLVEQTILDGVANGDFATEEPREAARAIIALSTSLAEPYEDMRRTMPQIIELYQEFARALASGWRVRGS